MATRTRVVVEDDIDGGPADQTIQFTVDGVRYEIDLSARNVEAFRAELAPWIDHARRVGRRHTRRNARAASGPVLADVRAWAREHGHTVSDRGRIPAEVQQAYRRAH